MIKASAKKQIIDIWKEYIANEKVVYDTKGIIINDIDEKRRAAIEDIKGIVRRLQ